MIQILHNARCGKSRDCLAFLTESGKEFEVIKYLETVPTFEELKEIISKLGIKPIDLVRKKNLFGSKTSKTKLCQIPKSLKL